ncbi:hypothetical protein HPP92_022652 [Vanilla planifolia]|uniref:Uncharacterized protein n=1 Tax=Vanilla planifolia TaxID=51239 RepID=A0A835UDU3_VANPL|nr:hypothetical protein HPP92_022652 [Vanilla planifolia]
MASAVGNFQFLKVCTVSVVGNILRQGSLIPYLNSERWTEEEHKKFIEALQLYGRAWRRIEEHVGTKDCCADSKPRSEVLLKVMRCKRCWFWEREDNRDPPPSKEETKPSLSSKNKFILHQEFLSSWEARQPSSMVFAFPEEENGSPTSVLSMAGSESTVDRDDTHLKLGLPHTGQIFEDSYPMGLCMMSEEQIQLKEPPAEEPTIPTLKLFGRTVVVSDCSKKSPARPDAVVHNSALEIADENHGNVMNLDMGLPTGRRAYPK